MKLLHRVLLAQFRAFLAIGRSNREFYLRNGVRSEAIFSGNYCVDNDRFASQAETLRPRRNELRSAWSVPANAFVFLFCGKLVEKKRPMHTIEALSRAHRADTPLGAVHLLVVGDGELRSACEVAAREREISISFTGFLNQTEIAKAYAVADCLVLPSDYGETWGLVVNEAMACGLPAVVSDRVGCHLDLVISGETGEVFPFGDLDAFASALARMLSSPVWAQAMGQRAQRRVQEYSMARAVDGTIAAVKYVMRRSAQPPC